MERFLLDVVRFFISLEPSNALLFNFVYLVLLIIPLLLYGCVISISLSGERLLRRQFFLMLAGIAVGIISYRMIQIWWVLRGGIGEETNTWSETITINQLYFIEKIFPYIIMGSSSALVVALFEKETKKIVIFSILSASSSFLWLLITHKIQNLLGIVQIITALFVSCTCGLAVGLAVRKAREL